MTFLRGSVRDSASTAAGRASNFGVHVGMSNMNTDFGNGTSSLIAFILRNTAVEDEFAPSNWTTLPSNTTNGKTVRRFPRLQLSMGSTRRRI